MHVDQPNVLLSAQTTFSREWLMRSTGPMFMRRSERTLHHETTATADWKMKRRTFSGTGFQTVDSDGTCCEFVH